ncbi:MAG: FtsB family cell division protein [Alphaproteobacteria bacterium]
MRVTNIFSLFWQIIILLIMLFFLAGSVYHLMLGPNGIEARKEIRHNIEVSTAELDSVKKEYKQLYHKISLLNNEPPDLDLLEERVREVLDYGEPNEALMPFKE